MFFNFVLILFWLLAFVAPIGDYTRYFKSLADTRYIAPDKPMPSVMVSIMVPLASVPAPSPGLRYAPLVIPIYHSISSAQEARSTRFNRQKPIYHFMGELIVRFADMIGRPRPTKTKSHPIPSPTKVPITAYPASPVPASRVLEHTPTSASTGSTSDIDPVALWSKYKLLLGWVLVTFVVTISAFARFLARGRLEKGTPSLNGLDDVTGGSVSTEASLSTFDSILDIYGALPSSSTCEEFLTPSNPLNLAPEDVPLLDATNDELIGLDGYTNLDGSAPSNVASALFADIDTKSRAEGTTYTHGTLDGGKTLEPAVSISSIATVGIYAQGPLVATPLQRVSHHPSSVAQVYTPRHKRWLEKLVSHVKDMERRGDYYGRVYDNWNDSPGSETQVEGSPAEPPAAHGGDSDQMIFDQELGNRYTPAFVPRLVPAHLKPKVEGESVSTKKLDSADIPLVPNPLVERAGGSQESIGPNPLTTWLALRVVKSFGRSSLATPPRVSPTFAVGVSSLSMNPVHTEYQAAGNIYPAHVASPLSQFLEDY
ncbi:hypothetical protein B0J17DRAFT_721056 [Rhizoctonia solani]|nr:hypothetical protein B0J17DRAFT_721056 [Rhizoctonia solani]